MIETNWKPWQQAVLDEYEQFREYVVREDRREGKTSVLLEIALRRSLAGESVLYLGHTLNQSREAQLRVCRLSLEAVESARWLTGSGRLVFKSGGRITFGSVGQVNRGGGRGMSVDYVLVDDSEALSEEGYYSIAPAARKGLVFARCVRRRAKVDVE